MRKSLPGKNPPRLSARHHHMLGAFDGTQILRALEGRGVCTAELAHAALYLAYGLMIVLLHPLLQSLLEILKVFDAVANERGAEHCDARPHQEELDDVFRFVDSAAGRQASSHPAIQDADPGERQTQGLRRAE